MILTRSDIKHLADLARLHVSDDEADRLSRDLTEIVGFIDRAYEQDDSGEDPMIRPSRVDGVVRDDVPDVASNAGHSVEQAAETEDGFVRVPPVDGMRSSSDSRGGSSE